MTHTHGLVVGKFLPLHAGHSNLIRAARRECVRLSVQLLARRDEPIPRDIREHWLREEHPDVEVVAAWDEHPVDFDDPVAWTAHVSVITSLLDSPVDLVATSDQYGAELARRLNARWLQFDPGRSLIPVSGTAIRASPAGFWWALGPAVRSWYVQRIVVVGAESTGTTTLASDLARRIGAPWVEEFGREWSMRRPGGLRSPWRSEEFDTIAAEQSSREDRAARVAPRPWLVCDTDALATGVWRERYTGERSESVEALAASRPPRLYILTSDDIPFVQDGWRDGEHLRWSMTRRFREVLSTCGHPWIEVAGTRRERVEKVLRRLGPL